MGLRLALLAAMLAASREWGRGRPVGPGLSGGAGAAPVLPGASGVSGWPGMVSPGVVVGMLRGGGGPWEGPGARLLGSFLTKC